MDGACPLLYSSGSAGITLGSRRGGVNLHSRLRTSATLAVALLALQSLVPSTALSDAIDNLQPGEWYEAPGSHLRSVVPVPTPVGNPTAIVEAWSGGAYDTVGDRLLVFGGGHADYGGNEVYAFSSRSLSWSRIWGPSSVDMIAAAGAASSCVSALPDGNPVSRHSYCGLQYLPAQNSFFLFGGSMFQCGGGAHDAWLLHLDTGRWERRSDSPTMAGLGSSSVYDPGTGKVLVSDAFGYWLDEYDPVTDRWTRRNDVSANYNKTGAIDTKRRRAVFVGGGEVVTYDLTGSTTYPRQVIATTGSTAAVGAEAPGFVYDPVSDQFVAWIGGADVYTLNPVTWAWTRRPPASTNSVIPTAPTAEGTYGRFRYMPSRNAFVVVNSIDQNVYLYRLSSGSGTPPPADSVGPSAPVDLRPR